MLHAAAKKNLILLIKDTIDRVKRQSPQASGRFWLGRIGNFQDKSREWEWYGRNERGQCGDDGDTGHQSDSWVVS